MRVGLTTPRTLTFMIASHSSSVLSPSGVRAMMPAHSTRMSILPCLAITASITLSVSAREVTSYCTYSTPAPMSSLAARSVAITFAPAAANAAEIARPMPPAPPVMKATCPLKSAGPLICCVISFAP